MEFLGYHVDALTLICLLLFMGAMGKSAQFLLHTWLPDAMEGPTPVSALIHAATMVTAGVFMVARLSPLFELAPIALGFVAIIGATTAFFAATVGLVQTDIKRVVAYSTCSQLGYMFAAEGVGAYGAGIFHLFTHASFKALLFLGAGAVIHALHHEQDMRRMGGLRKVLPFTFAMMLIGTLSLTGFPFTAGFVSKDAIIEATYAAHTSGRQLRLRADADRRRAHLVLFLAADVPRLRGQAARAQGGAGARARAALDHGSAARPARSRRAPARRAVRASLHRGRAGRVLARVDRHPRGDASRGADLGHAFAPTVAMALGFATAWYFYITNPLVPFGLSKRFRGAYLFLLNAWYFDALYDALFVRPAMRLGRFLWKTGDGTIIDGIGPDGVSARVIDIANRAVKLQSGYIYHYAFAMLIGVAALITYFLFSGGGLKP